MKTIYSAGAVNTVAIGVGNYDNSDELRIVNYSSAGIIIKKITVYINVPDGLSQATYQPFVRIASAIPSKTMQTLIATPGLIRLNERAELKLISERSAEWTGELYLPPDYLDEISIRVFFGVLTAVTGSALNVDIRYCINYERDN